MTLEEAQNAVQARNEINTCMKIAASHRRIFNKATMEVKDSTTRIDTLETRIKKLLGAYTSLEEMEMYQNVEYVETLENYLGLLEAEKVKLTDAKVTLVMVKQAMEVYNSNTGE